MMMHQREFYPILITVYNREFHFRKCIESLAKCAGASKSPLFIAIDAPSDEKDIFPNQNIKSYAKTIKGFKNLEIIERSHNLGPRTNAELMRQEIFSKYECQIVSEDDNIFSPSFLTFINKGLKLYSENEKIFSINGYSLPVSIPSDYEESVYIWRGFIGWGYGIWKSKYNDINFSLKKLKNFLLNPVNIYKCYKISDHYVPNMLFSLNTKTIHGDTFIIKHLIKNNLYCIFPINTLVNNIGFDGSGVHFKKYNMNNQSLFNRQLPVNFKFNDTNIVHNNEICYAIKNYYKFDQKKKMTSLLKLLTLLR